MKKSGYVLACAVLVIIFYSSCVMALTYSVSNISFKQNYSLGEPVSGSFFLSLTNAPTDLVFNSSFGQIVLREFLTRTGRSLSCESYNCTSLYSISDNGSQTKQINTSGAGRTLGLYLVGNGAHTNGLNLTLSSTFGEYDSLPFSIKIADSYVWNFDLASGDLNNPRLVSSGCFNSSYPIVYGNLIDSFGYCERITLPASRSYYIGANISGTSSITDFEMSLKKNGGQIGSCEFSIYSADYTKGSGCLINLSQSSVAGSYDVCIRSEADLSNYTILKEVSGSSCGYYKNSVNLSSDYSIFAIVPKYSSLAGNVDLGEEFSSGASNAINYYLDVRYPNDCAGGCVVPISFYGQNVVLNMENIGLRYGTNDGPVLKDKIYEVLLIKPKINFSDYISLDSFNWLVNYFGKKNTTIYLNEGTTQNNLFVLTTEVFESPIVKNIYPISPPAGMNVIFYADVLYNFSKLEWNFGDGSSTITTVGHFATHNYENASQQYVINVTAYGGNHSATKSFVVNTVSPQNYLNTSFELKRKMLIDLGQKIDTFPLLYREFVRSKSNITEFSYQLEQLDLERTQVYTNEGFVSIAQRLISLIVPSSIILAEKKVMLIGSTSTIINPSLVKEISPGNYSDLSIYKDAIFTWGLDNFDLQITQEKLRLYNENNIASDLITVYNINLQSKADKTAYFFIQEAPVNLHFDSAADKKDMDNAVYLEIPAGESRSFSFFISGFKDVGMFVSPILRDLSIGNNVAPCNFNKVCQKNLGENYKNCRSDCKPVWPTILWLILILILILILYTLLQVWYKVRYEKHLFKDRIYLFNLVSFINNSKLRNVSYGEIDSELRRKNWSGEQISYAIKKANGKNTGMYELIPVDRISAYFAMKEAKKNVGQQTVAIANPYSSRTSSAPSRQPTRFNPQNPRFDDKNNFRKI